MIHLKESDEKAVTLANSLKDNLKADGLWDVIVEQLVGLITDGASAMVGSKGGMGVIMEKLIGRKIPVKVPFSS